MQRRQLLLLLAACLLLVALTSGLPRALAGAFQTPAADKPLTRAPITAPKVALTFDLTWGEVELKKILDLLDQHGAKATFFVGGTILGSRADLIKLIAARGHEVGTLGLKIINLSGLPENEIRENLLAAQSVLGKTLGGPARYFRPPQGPATPELVKAARTAGLITVTHSIESGDYDERWPETTTKKVLEAVQKGDIIHLTASDFAPTTAKALPAILKGLKERKLEPVVLSQLGGE
jgi:peptidoglycan/xylan/chitin deacetylase (PgdA/CDA1 family)